MIHGWISAVKYTSDNHAQTTGKRVTELGYQRWVIARGQRTLRCSCGQTLVQAKTLVSIGTGMGLGIVDIVMERVSIGIVRVLGRLGLKTILLLLLSFKFVVHTPILADQ